MNLFAIVRYVHYQDTRYKMVLLPFHVYNYTRIRHYSYIDIYTIFKFVARYDARTRHYSHIDIAQYLSSLQNMINI